MEREEPRILAGHTILSSSTDSQEGNVAKLGNLRKFRHQRAACFFFSRLDSSFDDSNVERETQCNNPVTTRKHTKTNRSATIRRESHESFSNLFFTGFFSPPPPSWRGAVFFFFSPVTFFFGKKNVQNGTAGPGGGRS